MATYDTTMWQGETWRRVLTWQTGTPPAAVNLTGWTARMHVRVDPAAALTLTLTTENGRITLGGAAGTITLLVDAATTAALSPGRYVYDLELVSGSGEVTHLIGGVVEVLAEVTR